MKNVLSIFACATLLTCPALAGSIPVPNGDFNSGTVVVHTSTSTAVSDFTISNPTTNFVGVQSYPGGVTAAFINGGADGNGTPTPTTFTSGTLATIAPLTTYKLSLEVGYDSANSSTNNNGGVGGFNFPTDATLTLLANGGSTGIATFVPKATIVADAVNNGSGVYFATYTYSFTTGVSGGFVGDNLSVQFGANVPSGHGSQNSQTLFDNVTIDTAAVPEPSTWALLGLGAAAMVMVRRWRGAAA